MAELLVELASYYDANPEVDVLLCAESPGGNPPKSTGERITRDDAVEILSTVAGSLRSSLVVAKLLGRFKPLLDRAEQPERAVPALRFASFQEALEAARRLDAGEVMDPSVALETAADQSGGWLTIVCAADNEANAAAWADAEARAAARGATADALMCFLALDFVDNEGIKQNLLSMLWA